MAGKLVSLVLALAACFILTACEAGKQARPEPPKDPNTYVKLEEGRQRFGLVSVEVNKYSYLLVPEGFTADDFFSGRGRSGNGGFTICQGASGKDSKRAVEVISVERSNGRSIKDYAQAVRKKMRGNTPVLDFGKDVYAFTWAYSSNLYPTHTVIVMQLAGTDIFLSFFRPTDVTGHAIMPTLEEAE